MESGRHRTEFVLHQGRRSRIVDEERRFVANGFESMPAVARNADDLLIVFVNHERVKFALCRGVITVIVDSPVIRPFGQTKWSIWPSRCRCHALTTPRYVVK